MAYAPFPSNDGSEMHDPARAAGLRLSDAESIASTRLQTEGDGSLKEALADVTAEHAASDDIERLADRIEAAQGGYAAAAAEPSPPPFSADGLFNGAANLALLELPEWGEARAHVAAELAELQSQPLFLQEEMRQAGSGTHWQRASRDAEPYRPADTRIADATREAKPAPAAAETPVAPAVAPISSALDTAAKLAADANAAAAALENLTRLLQTHQRPASVVPAPRHEPPRPEAVSKTAPVPRPEPPTASPGPVARKAAVGPVTPPKLRQPPPAQELRQFDVRGFVAGFALSWAIGAVLYIFLMIG